FPVELFRRDSGFERKRLFTVGRLKLRFSGGGRRRAAGPPPPPPPQVRVRPPPPPPRPQRAAPPPPVAVLRRRPPRRPRPPRAAQLRDVLRQVALLDEGVGPERLHQLVLAHHPSAVFDQHEQGVEDLRWQRRHPPVTH